MKMTKNKRLILDILEKEDLPLNALQIHKHCDFGPDLATVYRNLQSLEKDGAAESFVFECEDRGIERYYSVKREKHIHYLHCESCHRFLPLNICPFDSISNVIEDKYDFKIHQHFFMVKGLCSECREK